MRLHNLFEGYRVVPSIDRERYQERDGLEGPFRAANGKVYYYDPREGRAYDPDTDMYIDHDEYDDMNRAVAESDADGAIGPDYVDPEGKFVVVSDGDKFFSIGINQYADELPLTSRGFRSVDDAVEDAEELLSENWAAKAMSGKSPLKKKYQAPKDAEQDRYKRMKKAQYGAMMGSLKESESDEMGQAILRGLNDQTGYEFELDHVDHGYTETTYSFGYYPAQVFVAVAIDTEEQGTPGKPFWTITLDTLDGQEELASYRVDLKDASQLIQGNDAYIIASAVEEAMEESMDESTEEYGKSVERELDRRKKDKISKKDKETLAKLNDLMKNANESVNEEAADYVRDMMRVHGWSQAKAEAEAKKRFPDEYGIDPNAGRNIEIRIDGRPWKVVSNKGHASAIMKTLKAKGKDVTAFYTDKPVSPDTRKK